MRVCFGWLFIFMLGLALLQVHPVFAATYELEVAGKTPQAAENTGRLKALRTYLNTLMTPQDIKKHALALRKHVIKKLADLTVVEVLSTAQVNGRVQLKVKVTVLEEAVDAQLKTVPELAMLVQKKQAEAQKGEEGTDTPAKEAPNTKGAGGKESALIKQVLGGSSAEILQALESGANAAVEDKKGNSCLYLYLARKEAKDVAVVQALLAHGASASWVSKDATKSVLAQAIRNKDGAILAALLATKPALTWTNPKTGQSLVGLWLAEGGSAPEELAAFLDAGFDANAVLFDVLFDVAKRTVRAPKLLEVLLRKGADPNKVNANQDSVLMQACILNAAPHVTVLLEKDAKTNLINSQGMTALLYACEGQGTHTAIVEALLTHKADPNLSSPKRQGLTPLFAAVRQGRTDLAAALLAAGADVNGAVQNGTTPLLLALQRGNEAMVAKLLAKGANPNLCDAAGRSPLLLAFATQKVSLLKLMKEANCDFSQALLFRGERRTLKEMAQQYGTAEVQAYVAKVCP